MGFSAVPSPMKIRRKSAIGREDSCPVADALSGSPEVTVAAAELTRPTPRHSRREAAAAAHSNATVDGPPGCPPAPSQVTQRDVEDTAPRAGASVKSGAAGTGAAVTAGGTAVSRGAAAAGPPLDGGAATERLGRRVADSAAAPGVTPTRGAPTAGDGA